MKLKDYFYDKVTLVTITDCDGCPFGYIAKYGREEKNMIKGYVCEFDLDKKIIYKPTKECPVKNTTDCDGCPFGYIAKYGREEKNMIKSYVCEFDLDKKIIYKPTKECPVKNTGVFVEFYEEKCGKST